MENKNNPAIRVALFPPGRIVETPGAFEALQRNVANSSEYVCRHCHGDYGEMTEEDVQRNSASLEYGGRVMSSFSLPDKTTLWIITDDVTGQAVTTLLLPDEY